MYQFGPLCFALLLALVISVNVFFRETNTGLKLVTKQNIGDQIGTNYSYGTKLKQSIKLRDRVIE